MANSDIVNYFAGKSVFITGGTGFLGKVLVEKLLRCCPDIQRIYLLMRAKAGSDINARLQQLVDTKVFDGLRSQTKHGGEQGVFEKLTPIAGDITLPALGISATDAKVLCENVQIVFHSAATIKFNEDLKSAVEMNLKGTQRMVDLARQMRRLEAFIHVSTAYANCDKDEIYEEIYSPSVHPQRLIDCTDWMDQEMVQNITKQLIGKMPNTYAYTKGLTEYLLQQECGSIPLAIVRPSIVTAAYKEPMPGWIDNLNGPTGFIAGVSKGFLRALRFNAQLVGDIIPVEYPINLMIAAAWYTATHRPNNIIIYNSTTGHHNPMTWGRFKARGYECILKNPSSDAMWYPSTTVHLNPTLHKLDAFFYHTIPAYLFDLMSRLAGKRPKMVRLYDKADRAISALDFFTTRQWKFVNRNADMLQEKLSELDRRIFNFDVRTIDWDQYMENYVLGTRQYILKDDPKNIPQARKHLARMYWIRQVTRLAALTLFLLTWFRMFKRSS